MSRQHRTRTYRKGWTKEYLEKIINDCFTETVRKHQDMIIYTGAAGARSWRKAINRQKNLPIRKATLDKNRKKRWTKETREKYALITEQKWLEEQRELINKNTV